MSTLIQIAVPVIYETDTAKYKLTAAKDNCIIGRDSENKLQSFEWNTGNPVSQAISEHELDEALKNKVRRNFWARKLVHFWQGKTTAESVINSFAADDLIDIFESPDKGLRLKAQIPSLSDVLLKIVED